MSGKTCVSNSWQIGHWRSMYSVSVTGADGQPSVVPVWGMPLNSAATSAEAGSAPARLPTAKEDGEDDDNRHDGDDAAADRERSRRGRPGSSGALRLHGGRCPDLP